MKKTISPGHKRQVAERLVARGQCSMCAACRYFHLHRCTYAYKAKHPDAWLMKLKAAVRRLSRQYARWGYPKITKLLKDEGWEVLNVSCNVYDANWAWRSRHASQDVGAGVFPPGCRPRPNIPARFGPEILSTIRRSAVGVSKC